MLVFDGDYQFTSHPGRRYHFVLREQLRVGHVWIVLRVYYRVSVEQVNVALCSLVEE